MSRKMSHQIKVASYNLFQTRITQIDEWKQISVLFFRQIDIVLFIFLEQSTKAS